MLTLNCKKTSGPPLIRIEPKTPFPFWQKHVHFLRYFVLQKKPPTTYVSVVALTSLKKFRFQSRRSRQLRTLKDLDPCIRGLDRVV
jgi:hypothetical protein